MTEAVALRPEAGPLRSRPAPVKLYAAPPKPRHLRRRLDFSKLPRVPGLDHSSVEGVRYRETCLALLHRVGLVGPPPDAVLPSLREVGRLTLDLDRLQEMEAAEQCSKEPRQQVLRGLRSEQRRTRSQLRTHERIVLAIAAEIRPTVEHHAADALARLTGGA